MCCEAGLYVGCTKGTGCGVNEKVPEADRAISWSEAGPEIAQSETGPGIGSEVKLGQVLAVE